MKGEVDLKRRKSSRYSAVVHVAAQKKTNRHVLRRDGCRRHSLPNTRNNKNNFLVELSLLLLRLLFYLSEVSLPHTRVSAQRFVVSIYGVAFVF